MDRRAVSGTEEKTLEFGLRDGARARAIVARDPAVEAVIPRIDFVGLGTERGAATVPFLGVGVDPEPEAKATLAGDLIVSGHYLSGDGGDGVVLGTGMAVGPRRSKPGDSITLMATTPDATLNAVDATVVGLVDVRIKELNDRYVAIGERSGGHGCFSPTDTVSKLVVFLKKDADESRTAQRLEQALTAAGYPVAVRHWKELAVFYGQVRLLYIGIFGFVGAVLVVIVILSAAIVMTMAVDGAHPRDRHAARARNAAVGHPADVPGGGHRDRARRAARPGRCSRSSSASALNALGHHPAAAARRDARNADQRASSIRWRTRAGIRRDGR